MVHSVNIICFFCLSINSYEYCNNKIAKNEDIVKCLTVFLLTNADGLVLLVEFYSKIVEIKIPSN